MSRTARKAAVDHLCKTLMAHHKIRNATTSIHLTTKKQKDGSVEFTVKGRIVPKEKKRSVH